jgi:2-methylcitrate dehydratase PrpD
MSGPVAEPDPACGAERTLTEGLWALALRPAAPADRARAALQLLDWLGCALAGSATETGRGLLSVLSPEGRPFALAPEAMAAALGGLGSILEMDDVHRTALLHPGPVVVPAALAMAGAGGDLAAALLAGTEAMVRLGRAAGPGHYALFHPTATCGGLGAAAAAARAAGLAPAAAASAMGHAMSLAGGLWQCRNEPAMTKHWHVAEAARRGVAAARLAAAGLPGPRAILEGPQGFFAGLAPGGDPARVLAPAPGWLLHEVSFKPWPACRHAHPAIDAALALRAEVGAAPVAAVRVETYADAVAFCDRPAPVTPAEARFSLQHAVAVALARGAPALCDFDAPQAAPAAVAALRAKVTVAEAARFTARYPAHFGARVAVRLADGRALAAEVADAFGDPEVPMDAAAVVAKFHRLAAAGGIGGAEAGALADAALAAARPEGAARLISLLRPLSLPAA